MTVHLRHQPSPERVPSMVPISQLCGVFVAPVGTTNITPPSPQTIGVTQRNPKTVNRTVAMEMKEMKAINLSSLYLYFRRRSGDLGLPVSPHTVTPALCLLLLIDYRLFILSHLLSILISDLNSAYFPSFSSTRSTTLCIFQIVSPSIV